MNLPILTIEEQVDILMNNNTNVILKNEGSTPEGNSCYDCIHARSIPGDNHIACMNGPEELEVKEHGVKQGWFVFPANFDPVWRSGECANHESSSSK